MIKTNYLFLAGLLLILFTGQSKAQTLSRSALEDKAYDYLNNNEFVKAYEAFDQLHARYPKEADYEFKLGICCLSYPEKKARAIEIFTDMRNKYKTREAEFYLGRAYHTNYRFDEALTVLQPLVEAISTSKKKEDKTMTADATQIINNCINGKILMQNKISFNVQNIGSPINTKEIEGVPVITADESMMIFTYVGKKSTGGRVNERLESDASGVYTSDIYMSTRIGDSAWKAPEPVKALNTKGNDAAIAISPDGLTLFTFLSTNEIIGDIYVSRLKGNEFSKPEPLNSNINTFDYWEGSCSISADGKLLYFSSDRPTGLGGRDIWVSELVNGDWGPAVNLGPKINTPYDDDAPFIHPDGVTLFFSSKGHASIGGYDIMFSTKQEDGEWGEPKTMGIPLNTTEDDSYYVINSKGDKGYFSSDRATSDGRGGQDIYMVNPGIIGDKPIVALYKGIIYGDGTPVEANIEITKAGKEGSPSTYTSNKSTGRFLFTLKPGFVYKIKVTADGYDSFEEEMNLETLTGYIENKKDISIFSKAYAAVNPDKVANANSVWNKNINNVSSTIQSHTMEDPFPDGNIPADKPVTVVTFTKSPEVKAKEEQRRIALAAQKEEARIKKEAAQAKEEERVMIAAAKAEAKKEEARVKAEEKQAAVLAKAEAKKRKQETREEPAAVSEAPVEAASPCSGTLPNLASLKGRSLNDPETYRQLMEIAGDYCAQNVVFKVQIGAYKNPEKFKYNNLKSLGKVESEIYPDGITRFTQRQFSNLKDAEKQRQKAIAKGQADSWIVVFVNGQRYTLEDFVNVDFLGKAVN